MTWGEFALAEDLLERAGALEAGPPTPVEPVLKVLAPEGLEMHYYDPGRAPAAMANAASGMDEVLVPDGGRWLLFVNQDRPRTRIRFSLWHGIGHFCLPSHRQLNYLARGCLMDPMTNRRYERQAHRFAAAMNMPPRHFQADMLDLPFSMRSVEHLAQRYVASVESAALHYVALSNIPCAVLRIRPDYDDRGLAQPQSPLRVRYQLRSQLFPYYIHPGTRIPLEDNLFWLCSEEEFLTEGEIEGSLLGLKREVRLSVECLPQGHTGDVLALVRLPEASEWETE